MAIPANPAAPPPRKRPKKKTSPLLWVLAPLFLALVAGVLGLRLGFALHTKPAWQDPLMVPASPYGMAAQPVEITTPDGVVLRGHFLPGSATAAAAGKATVVLLHDDVKRGIYDVVPVYAPPLVQAGYNVLAVSFRGSGASAGEMLGGFYLGQQRARLDVVGMLDWLAQRPESQGKPVALFGLGDGALPALMAAGRVQALVLDSPAATAGAAWSREFPWTRVPGVQPLMKLFGALAYNTSPFGREPADWARQAQVPALFIAGEADVAHGPQGAQGLAAVMPHAHVITAPTSPHLAAAGLYPGDYWAAVLAYLHQTLLGGPTANLPTAFTPAHANAAYADGEAGRLALAQHQYAQAVTLLDRARAQAPADQVVRYLAGVAHVAAGDAQGGQQLLAPLIAAPPANLPGPDLAVLQGWARVWLGHALDLQHQRDAALQHYAMAAGVDRTGPDPSGLEPTGPRERGQFWLTQVYSAPGH